MNAPTAYHQLGRFIVAFQQLEESVNNVLELLVTDADSESVRILANDLEYSKRLNAADVLFARFIDLAPIPEPNAQTEFHNLMVELKKLGERRNELVHSCYHPWRDVRGNDGLLRRHSRLAGSSGIRINKEEELQPEAFNNDLKRLEHAANKLESFRVRVINWLYPTDRP